MRRPFEGKYPITQEWGVNPQDYAKLGLKGHNGVDYATPIGTPILAPHNGTVVEAAYDATGYGTYVKIENDEEGSILAHLSKHLVNPGDYVTEGTQIGISGNTGNSTGPHLHWGYYRKPRNKSDGYSGTTNPWQYLDENKPKPPVDQCEAIKNELEVLKKDHEKCGDYSIQLSSLQSRVLTLERERNEAIISRDEYKKLAEDRGSRIDKAKVALS